MPCEATEAFCPRAVWSGTSERFMVSDFVLTSDLLSGGILLCSLGTLLARVRQLLFAMTGKVRDPVQG